MLRTAACRRDKIRFVWDQRVRGDGKSGAVVSPLAVSDAYCPLCGEKLARTTHAAKKLVVDRVRAPIARGKAALLGTRTYVSDRIAEARKPVCDT